MGATVAGLGDGAALPRPALVALLAGLVGAQRPPHVLRVAVDGPDAAGKTTLAAEVAAELRRTFAGARDVVVIGVDGFHRPRRMRYRRGSLSPEGYYEDSFDYAAIRAEVLHPLGSGGTGRYRTAVFDHRRDVPAPVPPRRATSGAVLLFEGVFLLRPELREHWDLSVFVDVSPQVALRRALERDAGLLGGAETVRERYLRRYLPGQELYRRRAAPTTFADVVIDNDDPQRPWVLAWPPMAR